MHPACNKPDYFSHRPIPLWFGFLFLFLLELIYNLNIRHLAGTNAIGMSALNAALYTAILALCLNCNLERITIFYLALPFLLFLPGWLNTPTAILMTCIFLYCTFQTLKYTNNTISRIPLTTRELSAFCLIIAWINLSGSGGYGYQSWDYVMHNSRLNDLIQKSWPVHYGKDLNLIYYVGYYLPSAAIGKLFGYIAATRSMFFWTLLGATLALRWAGQLSGWKLGTGLVIACVFFGPMDAAGLAWEIYNALPFPDSFTLQEATNIILNDTDTLDFWASNSLGFFNGNFLSNTFQMYWAPQHIIPGWLVISIITFYFLGNNTRNIVFIFCLLCLWSPLVMLSMAIFPLIAILNARQEKNKEWLSISNTIGATSITLLFIAFYFGGSAMKNHFAWTLSEIDNPIKLVTLLLFYLFAWGMYVSVIIKNHTIYNHQQKIWLAGLITTMLLLPLYIYGEYSDLLCRGSAPIMFLLMTFLLHLIKEKRKSRPEKAIIPILAFLLLGAGSTSALLQLHTSFKKYGENRPIIQVTEYKHAPENLGSDKSLFARFFRGKVSQ